MMATSEPITNSATMTGAWPRMRIEMYSHQVPAAYRPRPNQKPVQPASRGVGLRAHSAISSAGASNASHHWPKGANANESATPPAAAMRRGIHRGARAPRSCRLGSATLAVGGDGVGRGIAVVGHGHPQRLDAPAVGPQHAELVALQQCRLATARQPPEMRGDQPRDGVVLVI